MKRHNVMSLFSDSSPGSDVSSNKSANDKG